MKVLSIFGISKSGKTTTIESVIRELCRRGYTIGSVKEIHYEQFAIDTEGSNTDRHRKAGSTLVTALGLSETDVLYQNALPVREILKLYNHDFVVLEGVRDFPCPKIITAHSTQEIDERIDDTIFALSGVISNCTNDEYRGLPVISGISEIDRLVDLIEEKVFDVLPDFPAECCCACGSDCTGLCVKILNSDAKRSDCVLYQPEIKLRIDGDDIPMVPFVQRLLKNAILGVASELEGYKKDSKISIEF